MKTSSSPACPQCGASIPSGAPQGLCPACVLGAAMTPSPTEPDPRVPGRFPTLAQVQAAFPQLELLECIGAGGMGVVYKARQPHLDRVVALKLLPQNLAGDPRFAERFNREARLLARLNHPNIVIVHDFGQSGGFCFLLMEYVDGVNLREAMRAGRFSPAEALSIVPRICEALQFAHDEGVLHRDIKPENILLDGRGRVKIADFGIAKLLRETQSEVTLTASGASIGTPQYMAPEQIERPREVDHRADIYSLGVVFYEMLTGELPIGRFAPPSEKVPLDARVDEIVLRALAKERELRQQSAAQVGTEVEGVRTGTPATGRPAAPAAPPPGSAGSVPAGTPTSTLPGMARAIIAYALLVYPALWLLGLLTLVPDPVRGPYASFIQRITTLTEVIAGLGLLALWLVAGWRFRRLKPEGPRWIRTAIVLDLVLGGLVGAGTIFADHLSAQWNAGAGAVESAAALTAGDALLVVVFVAALVFEIVALVWLCRHRHSLAVLMADANPGSAAAAQERSDSAPATGRLPFATTGALLVMVSAVAGGWILSLGLLRGREAISAAAGAEVRLLVAGLSSLALPGLAVGIAATAGTLLGWLGLRHSRSMEGRPTGLGRALFSALVWPMLVLDLLLFGVAGGVLRHLIHHPLLLGLGLVALLGIANTLVLRRAWRWSRFGPGRHQPHSTPHWAPAVAFAVAFLVLGSTIPLALDQQQREWRRALPTLATVWRSAPNHDTPELTFHTTFSPRATTWIQSALASRTASTAAAPFPRVHVVNGGFEPVDGLVVVRPPAADAGQVQVWDVRVQVGTNVLSMSLAEPGVRWQRDALPGEWEVPAGPAGLTLPLFEGADPHGQEWSMSLITSVDALSPQFVFEGVELGRGADWESTARRRSDPDILALMSGPEERGAAGPRPAGAGASPHLVPVSEADRARAALRAEQARRRLSDVEAQVRVGALSPLELKVAQGAVQREEALARGDRAGAARADLAVAESRLMDQRRRYEAGQTTLSGLQEAETEVRLRQLDLDEVERRPASGDLPFGPTEPSPR